MKKILLGLGVACLGLTGTGYAQTIMSQDFESVTAPAIPGTWSLGGSTGSPSWFTTSAGGSTWGTLTGAYNVPSHTQYVMVDDDANPTQLHDTLKSPVFTAAGSTALWLNFDCFYYSAVNNSSGIAEHAYILGSTNGGSTWSVIDSVDGAGWGGSWFTQHTSLSTLTGANCRIAFTYSDGGGALLGVALDNIAVVNINSSDAAVPAISYNNIINGISINGETVSFQVQNLGLPITTFDMYYTINGGSVVSQTFTPTSFAPYTSQNFTFTTGIGGAVAGTNNLHVAIKSVNGVPTTNVDSFDNSTFTLAGGSAQRNGLVEEFTSSTCPPCASFAISFDPLCNSLKANDPTSHFNIIKYQMNWPDWSDDRSYNADGNSRRGYYAVNSIPMHFVNGTVDNTAWGSPFTSAQTTAFTNEFAAAASYKSFIDMAITYSVDTVAKKLYTVTTVTPHFTKTGTYKLYIGAADVHYQNIGNEWGMLDYYHAMRKMFPSGAGRSLASPTDGVAQVFYDTAVAYTAGDWVPASLKPADSASKYPRFNSNTFWNNPLLGSEVIAFVQEDATKDIMQSITAPATKKSGLGVSTMSQVNGISIYPNPAKETANLSFDLGMAGNVTVEIVEYTGRVVRSVANEQMTAGKKEVTLNTKGIVPGNYIVTIKTENGTNIQRLTVE